MSYSARLIITIPAALLSVGRAIGRALDPDTGGADSYTPVRGEPVGSDAEGMPVYAESPHWVADTPCRPEFLQQAFYLSAHPAALHAAVAADYADRWQDHTPPTLADCEAFCAEAVLSDGTPVEPLGADE